VARVKHIPLRSCISCGQQLSKGELVRIVRTPDGSVVVDPTGKRSGRGAYLCHDGRCWERGLKQSRLDQVLHALVAPSVKENLMVYYREQLRPKAA